MLRYVARPPVPPLAKFVEYLWAAQGAPAHAHERVVPTGTLELMVDLTGDEVRIYDAAGRCQRGAGAGVAGAYRRPFTFDTRASASVVGVHFRPGHAGAVLGVPPGELSDRHVALDALWGRRARELREQLCAASTTDQRFAILEAELVARLCERRVHPAVAHAVDALARPQTRVADLARTTGLGPRRLIETFHAAVGVTPKRFARILRFQRAVALARSSTLDWTRVAHASGYYDQAHLIRDFRELAELTPSQVMRASTHVSEPHQLAVSGR